MADCGPTRRFRMKAVYWIVPSVLTIHQNKEELNLFNSKLDPEGKNT
jgi:hypothetical protein